MMLDIEIFGLCLELRLDKSIIMLISAPVGFELGLRAELGNKPEISISSIIFN